MRFSKILKIVIYLQLIYLLFIGFYKDITYIRELDPIDKTIFYSTIICVIIALFTKDDNYIRKL
jgi:hypothetical protein